MEHKQKEHKIRKKFKEFIHEEGIKLKEMSFSEKAEYIWEYYKVHIIITAFLIFFTISLNFIGIPPFFQ